MEKPVKSHVYVFVQRARFWWAKKTFSMTYRKNGFLKRTLSQPLNIYTLDAITFCNMVKFTVSTKHETLLSLRGC